MTYVEELLPFKPPHINNKVDGFWRWRNDDEIADNDDEDDEDNDGKEEARLGIEGDGELSEAKEDSEAKEEEAEAKLECTDREPEEGSKERGR